MTKLYFPVAVNLYPPLLLLLLISPSFFSPQASKTSFVVYRAAALYLDLYTSVCDRSKTLTSGEKIWTTWVSAGVERKRGPRSIPLTRVNWLKNYIFFYFFFKFGNLSNKAHSGHLWCREMGRTRRMSSCLACKQHTAVCA